MRRRHFPLFIAIVFTACKGKKQEPPAEDTAFFPVLAYLKGQVAQVDSTLNRITKIETVDSTSDTTVIPREDFKKYAQDFTTIPDISTADIKNDYSESKTYDEALKSVLLTYTPKPDAKTEIIRQDVIAQPDASGNSEVRSIYIDRQLVRNDSTIRKIMLWQAGRKFSITTTTSAGNGPAITRKTELIWNDFSN